MKTQVFALCAFLSLHAVPVVAQGIFNESFCSCDLINVPVIDIVELDGTFCSATTSTRDIYECNLAGTCFCQRLDHMPLIQISPENASGIFECAMGATSKYLRLLNCGGATPSPSPSPSPSPAVGDLCIYETGGTTGNAAVADNGKPYLQMDFTNGALAKTGVWTVLAPGGNPNNGPFLELNTRVFYHTNAGQYPDPDTGVLTGVDMKTTFMYVDFYNLDKPDNNADDSHVQVATDQLDTTVGRYQEMQLCNSNSGCQNFSYELVSKMEFFKTGTTTPFTIGAFQVTMQRLALGERIGIAAGGIAQSNQNPSSYVLAASTQIAGPTVETMTYGNVSNTEWLMFEGVVKDVPQIPVEDLSVQAEWRDTDTWYMYYQSQVGNPDSDNDIEQGIWDFFLFISNPVCVPINT